MSLGDIALPQQNTISSHQIRVTLTTAAWPAVIRTSGGICVYFDQVALRASATKGQVAEVLTKCSSQAFRGMRGTLTAKKIQPSTVAHKGHAAFLDFHSRVFGCSVSVVQLKENARNVFTAVETFTPR